jgi:O-antigen/teichoic acid export membrane protein
LVSGSVGFASRAAIQLLIFFVMLIAARALTIAEFGIYSIAASLIVLSRNLFYVGPYEYLLKTPESPTLKGSCLLANLVIAALMAIVLVIFAFVSEFAFNTGAIAPIVLALTPSLLIAATTSWSEAILLRRLRVRSYYAVTVSAELVSAAVATGLLLAHVGLMALVVQVYIRLGALFVIYAVIVPDRDWRGRSLAETWQIIRWSSLRYSTVFINFMAAYGADFILGALLSPTATGIYRASNRIVSSLSDLFVQPLQKIVQTNLSARVARRLPLDSSWLTMFTGVAAIGWALLAGLGAGAGDIVPLLLGAKWAAAAPIIAVFCVARGLNLLDAATNALLVCYDRQRFMLTVQIAATIASLTLAVVLARYGLRAVAIGSACAVVALSVSYCHEAIRLSGGQMRDILPPIAATLVPVSTVIIAISLTHALSPAPAGPVWTSALLTIAAGGIGLLLGLLPIRRRLAVAIGHLGDADLRAAP